ncbi:MAG TPA: carboxypeptidase regulatory-like domain-containing protein [Acidimicrobiales bacterium]
MKKFVTGLHGRVSFVFFACTLVLGLLTALPAGAAADTSITGTVTAAGAVPLPNICVSVQSTSGGGVLMTAVTGSDGTYSLTSLDPGTYNVVFFSQGYGCSGTGGDYARQWYNGSPFAGTNASDGLAVTTSESGPTIGINAVMAAGSDISGTVTAAAGGAPIPNVCVFASGTSGVAYGFVNTASDGTYDIEGLSAGSYIVNFYVQSGCAAGNYAEQWYSTTSPGTINRGDATAVSLTGGAQQSGIDAVMTAGATITGTVTSPSGGVDSVCVHAYASTGFEGNAITASDGSFSITGLPDDNYTFEYDPTCNFTQVSPYEDVITTTPTPLAAGSPIDESYELLDAGVISGTITSSEAPGGVSGVCVNVYQSTGGADYGSATTANDGTYSIGNLAVGSFTVVVDPTCGSSVASPYQIDNVTNPVSVASAMTTTVNAVITANPGSFANVISPSTNPGTGTIGGTYAASATATSGDTVAITLNGSSTGCTISSGLVTFTAVGTCLVDFNDTTSGSSPYVSATQVQQSISVSAGSGGGGGGGGGGGVITTTTTAPPTTTTTAPPTTTTTTAPPAVKPKAVAFGFGPNSASLNANERNALGALLKKLKSGASITITAYAKNNRQLAKHRADVVAKFLMSRKGLHVTIKWVTKTGSNNVSIVTTKQ